MIDSGKAESHCFFLTHFCWFQGTEMQGTVPYLGTFLFDLSMLDAIPGKTDGKSRISLPKFACLKFPAKHFSACLKLQLQHFRFVRSIFFGEGFDPTTHI